MPKALLDKLPQKAKEIYESAWSEAKEKGWDDERAAKYAIGAVKQAGFRKSKDKWVKMGDVSFFIFGEPLSGDEWVEVACTGSVVDMHGSSVSISDKDMDEWIRAYDEGRRGQDLPITYDHPKSGGIAAGWIRGLRKGSPREIRGKTRTPFLMRPEWTAKGRKSIDDRDYQYTSLEILPDNQLRAVSLVNFPAIKGLKPVTEAVLGENVYCLEEFYMAEKEKPFEKRAPEKAPEGAKCPSCGAPVPEGADSCPACGKELKEKVMSEQVNLEEFKNLKAQMATLLEERETDRTALEEMQGKYESAETERKVLSDSNEKLTTQTATLVELNNMMRLHEKVLDFMRFADNRAIAPAYEEQIINVLLMTEDIGEEQKILDLLKNLADGSAVVEFGEKGTGGIPGPLVEGPGDGRKRLSDKAFKYAKEHEVDYKTALIEVSRQEESK